VPIDRDQLQDSGVVPGVLTEDLRRGGQQDRAGADPAPLGEPLRGDRHRGRIHPEAHEAFGGPIGRRAREHRRGDGAQRPAPVLDGGLAPSRLHALGLQPGLLDRLPLGRGEHLAGQQGLQVGENRADGPEVNGEMRERQCDVRRRGAGQDDRAPDRPLGGVVEGGSGQGPGDLGGGVGRRGRRGLDVGGGQAAVAHHLLDRSFGCVPEMGAERLVPFQQGRQCAVDPGLRGPRRQGHDSVAVEEVCLGTEPADRSPDRLLPPAHRSGFGPEPVELQHAVTSKIHVGSPDSRCSLLQGAAWPASNSRALRSGSV
jgi:hypothetical protein